MALLNFISKVTQIPAAWLNAVDAIKFTIFADATTKAQARTALTSDAPMSVAQGGTEATTAAGARTALAVAGTGVANTFTEDQSINGLKVGRGGGAISSNTAFGSSALLGNTTGSTNTAIGFGALDANTTASGNTAVGSAALGSVVTGANNTAVGASCLSANTASSNTAVGTLAAASTTSGANNTAVGASASFANTTGSQNTTLGATAGSTITTGSNLTCLGYDAEPTAATATNEITLGNASVATLRCQVTSITALSDARDKKEVVDLPLGLDFINSLRPVKFTWNRRDGSKKDTQEAGFIAQELDASQTKFDAEEYLQLVLKTNPDKLEAAPGKLLPILVKAIQELSAKNAELEARLNDLQS